MDVVSSSVRGLGFEIALALARAGADVIVTGRLQTDGHEALAKIRPLAPGALVRFEKLDLESQASVSSFADRLTRTGRPIDLLVNNACTLVLLNRQVTLDGFELHLATNYLSHFALTAQLLPLLRSSKQPRVVQVTSTGRHHGAIHLSNLQLEREYTPLKAYSQSKLAMLIFAIELQRRSDVNGWGLTAAAAQPIGPRAALIANATEVTGSLSWYRRALGLAANQSSGDALGTLLTPTVTTGKREECSDTKSLIELIGPPVPEALDMRALDPAMGSNLWEISTGLTGADWPVV